MARKPLTLEEKERRKGLTKAILANANAEKPLSYANLATHLQCDIKTVYELVSRLRRQGRIAPSTRQFSRHSYPLATQTGVGSDHARSEIVAQILEHEPLMDADERLKALSRLGRTGADPVKRQAIMDLEELTASKGGGIGPPPPFTPQDRADRLSRLFLMVGHEVVAQAIKQVFLLDIELPPVGRTIPPPPESKPTSLVELEFKQEAIGEDTTPAEGA